MTDKRLVLSTAGSREEAERLATTLVERKLAACVNVVGPIASVYRWAGKVERAEEFLLLIKSAADQFDALSQAIAELHSYDVPECIEVAVTAGSEPYLRWLAESLE